jgi:fluoroquinolone resistance protein
MPSASGRGVSGRGVSIGAGTEYENVTFGREASLPPRLECVDFTDCTFSGLEFRSARLLSCRFFDCRFERVDASAADFTDCTFRGTTFHDSKFLGINWTILRALQAARWERCLLDGGCFQALQLESAEWLESRLREVDFSECNLTQACFIGSQLEGANFNGANLRQADFTRATGVLFDPKQVKLEQTQIELDALMRMAGALGLKIAQ